MVNNRMLRLAEKAAWDEFRLYVREKLKGTKDVLVGDPGARALGAVWARARREYQDAIGVPRRMANITARRRHKRRMEA